MVVNIPENGISLESSAKVMAGLPTQAFAITLNDNMIEDMIKCVQDGGALQLSLGSTPVSGSSPFLHLVIRTWGGRKWTCYSVRFLLYMLFSRVPIVHIHPTIAAIVVSLTTVLLLWSIHRNICSHAIAYLLILALNLDSNRAPGLPL